MLSYTMNEQEQCVSDGDTWTEKDGTWMCVHPDQSDDSSEKVSDESSEEEAM